MSASPWTRRKLVGGAFVLACVSPACAAGRVSQPLTVYKTPTCPCCDGWIEHMRVAGFSPTVVVHEDIRAIAGERGLPSALASCHTGIIGEYLVEGHVPAEDVMRLLDERPKAIGLAVPGMPLGSPGMETQQGHKDPFDTVLILPSGETRVFNSHNQ